MSSVAVATQTADRQSAADVPFQRSRRTRTSRPSAPLGSLTQLQHRHASTCRSCQSPRITRLAMSLTDGTPVQFTSCHVCETRSWEHDGIELSVDSVLDRTRKQA